MDLHDTLVRLKQCSCFMLIIFHDVTRKYTVFKFQMFYTREEGSWGTSKFLYAVTHSDRAMLILACDHIQWLQKFMPI